MNIETALAAMFPSGNLEVGLPGGRRIMFGDGSGLPIAVSIRDRLTLARIAARPSLAAGEAYMNGWLTMERGSIRDLVELTGRNAAARAVGPKPGMLKPLDDRPVE